MISINLKEAYIKAGHIPVTTIEPGFMFKDLKGNPMMVKSIKVTRYIKPDNTK